MNEPNWFEPLSWTQKWRRIYIATWPISAPIVGLLTVLFLLGCVVLFLVLVIVGTPFAWLYEKAENIYWDLKYEWNKP